MRFAWFRPSAARATAELIAELRSTHHLDAYTEANAHEFVWRQFRAPYDLCVFELDNTASHAFIWPYLLHYGGALILTSPTLHDARARALADARRQNDYAAEFLFSEGRPPVRTYTAPWTRRGGWPMLRVPLTAARLTVVPYRGLADVLRDQYPHARIVYAPLAFRPAETPRVRQAVPGAMVTFGMLADDRVEVARRAVARAQAAGATAALVTDTASEHLLREADVVLALPLPACGEGLALARAAMAEGRPVVALETLLTADWPVLDPQTWRSRGLSADPPVAITVDLRDEEHSLAVAIRRLSADAALRSQLGEAAHAWSRSHESVAVAVDAWQAVLGEAVRLEAPAHPAEWPPHLAADGTERARAMLAEFGVTVDLFG